jgi:hypothetical protein
MRQRSKRLNKKNRTLRFTDRYTIRIGAWHALMSSPGYEEYRRTHGQRILVLARRYAKLGALETSYAARHHLIAMLPFDPLFAPPRTCCTPSSVNVLRP